MADAPDAALIDPTFLPNQPNEWSRDVGGFRQRWAPGAFGDRETIDDVYGFLVLEDRWEDENVDGLPARTILKAEVRDVLPPA